MKNISDDRGVVRKGEHLANATIDFIVAGGIAAIETPRIIRELRRYGATIRPVLTEAGQQFITPLSLEWASRNSVLTQLSGSAEHITNADAVIVAPATLDFISKLSLGIADSHPLTLLQSVIGRRPVFVFPTMHESLWENQIFQENLSRLKKIPQVHVFDFDEVENKRKIPQPEIFTALICHHLTGSTLRGKSFVVTLGGTRSYIDDIRFVSNISTGAMGVEIAKELYLRGADVSVISGSRSVGIPAFLRHQSVETIEEMEQCLKKKGRVDCAILAAAVLDFQVMKRMKGKQSSDLGTKSLQIDLIPTKKIIDGQRTRSKLLVGFKLESGGSAAALQEKVRDWNKKKKCDLVVCNLLQGISKDKHEAFVYDSASNKFSDGKTKTEIAKLLADSLELHF